MIKVIIADDEENVCRLIENLIDWDALGMSIVGIAHNGVEVLDMIRGYGPDLIITDIRMPGYDGLEMIRRAKEMDGKLQFIIISGYGHFEYAQHAVKYGVGDYLLKPIKKSELLSALEKVRGRYARRIKQVNEEEQLKKQIESDTDRLHENLFKDLFMKRDFTSDDMTIAAINSAYHYSFMEGIFQVICVKIDCGYDDQYDNAIPILEEKVTQILNNALSGHCFEMGIYPADSTVYCIANYAEGSKKSIRNQFMVVLDELAQQRAAFEQFDFTVCVGEAYDDINKFKDSYNSAVYAAGQRLIAGTGRLVEDSAAGNSHELKTRLLAELNRSMGPAIEVMDADGIVNDLSNFHAKVIYAKNLSGLDIVSLSEEAYAIYLTQLRNNGIFIDDRNELTDKFRTHVWRCRTVDEIFQYLNEEISGSMKSVIEQKKQEESKPIRIVKKYIQENYMKPVTLEETSAMVGFNSAYFSTLFKKMCGVNFTDYLTETRINKAKELLRDTDLNIADICGRVGYSDLKYFTQNFRKLTGLKPREYRKLYS